MTTLASRSAACAAALLFGLGATACKPARPVLDAPVRAVALPVTVKGATLRPVGDRRRGYGTKTARQTMERLRGLGTNTLGILMEGRLEHAGATEVRGPTREDLEATRAALLDANALGFATVLVPHLYVDDGTWRGDLTFEEDAAMDRWWASYRAFLLSAASVAQSTGTTVLSVAVELKGMSADPRGVERMETLTEQIRRQYDGKLTYSANWDEAERVQWWHTVDLAGVNGYYPLVPDPIRGAENVARRLTALGEAADRPVLVTEVGYRASPLSHVRPWEWPDQVDATVDDAAQAQAWAAVLTQWLTARRVRGLLVWVVPSDPDDPASEPRHGFNPLNKPAERVISEVFHEIPDSAS